MSLLVQRYARAAFEVASQRGAIDAVAADLAGVAAALDDAAVRAVLLDPGTRRQQRRAVLARLMPDAHELSRGLVAVVLERRREAILPALHQAFTELARAARGEVEGVVESARPLAEDQVRELENVLSGRVGQQVKLRAEIQPALLGGVRVRVGNSLYDGSVATALEDLERRLMEAPVP